MPISVDFFPLIFYDHVRRPLNNFSREAVSFLLRHSGTNNRAAEVIMQTATLKQQTQCDPQDFLNNMLTVVLDAVRGEKRVPEFLPTPPKGRTVVVGAGKAAAAMAKAVEDHYKGIIDAGLVVTRHRHGVPLKQIELVEADHPVPGEAGQKAAERILHLATTLGPNDLLLCLISGGCSALLPLPAAGLTLLDLQAVNKSLLLSGATIHEFNCVRKHLSAISGGRLARAANGAQVISLIISDVPGDDLSVIASGPTVGDPTSFADAREVFQRYKVTPPPAIAQYLADAREETVKPDDACLTRVKNILIVTPQDALEAAAAYARRHGVTPLILGNAIEGEARDVAIVMAGMTKQIIQHNQPIPAPCVLVSGGETTVTVKGNGKGGRNSEFILYFLMEMQGNPRAHAISCGTDGSDGTENNAGAVMHPDIFGKAAAQGIKANEYARSNDSYSFFKLFDALIETGPTRTNVNDFRAIYVTR
jgi:glycerate 2-kinase